MITGSNIDRKKSPRRMLSFPCKVGSNHAFIESPSNSVKLDANICNGGTSSSGLHNLGGISLQGLNQFAMDFDLHPSLLPQSLLFEIFEDVIAGNSTKFRSNSSSSDGKSPSQSACIVSPDASWNSSSRKVQSPAADEVEPLLSLAQVRISYSPTHSLTLSLYLFITLSFITLSLYHFITLSLPNTLTHSLTRSLVYAHTHTHTSSLALAHFLWLLKFLSLLPPLSVNPASHFFCSFQQSSTTLRMMHHFTILYTKL